MNIKSFVLFVIMLAFISCNKDNPDNSIPTPVASFTDTVIGTLPVVVNFINTSTGPGPGVVYFWKFGDGATSALQNPIHSYNSFASYDVKLIQTSMLGVSDSVTKNINIIASGKPGDNQSVDFSYSVGSAAPFTVNFTNTSQNAASYFWDFGDGATSTISTSTLSHIYTSGGTYIIKLKVTSTGGVDSTSKTLILH